MQQIEPSITDAHKFIKSLLCSIEAIFPIDVHHTATILVLSVAITLYEYIFLLITNTDKMVANGDQ